MSEGIDNFVRWSDRWLDEDSVVEGISSARVVLLVAPENPYSFGPPDQFQEQAEYIKILTSSYPANRIGVSTREIFSPDDLEGCLDQIRRLNERSENKNGYPVVDMIHFVGHGDSDGIVFPNAEFLDLTKKRNREMFANLGLEWLLFSCCQFGKKKRGLIDKLADEGAANVVLAYRREVLHHEAFLIDSMIYHMAYGQEVRRRISYKESCSRLMDVVRDGLVYHQGPGGGLNPLVWSTGS